MDMPRKQEPYWPLILLLAIVKFVLPLFLQSSLYELHRDEYLYFAQGQHPALGYLENPPLISWLGMISGWFGDSVAWIKFWPCLFGAATVILTCLTTAELGGGRFAQFLAAIGIMTGGLMRVHFLFQPNMLDIFCWTLTIYYLIRYLNTQRDAAIYGLAISLAIGWWSKYSILFMAISLIIGLLLTYHRRIFLRATTWKAAALALLIMLPNIWWQYAHNWPLLHHMKELRETQLDYVNPSDFIKEQFFLFFPTLIVWIPGLIWLLVHRTYRIVAVIYFSIIILLALGSGKGYYAFGAYPMLLAAGGAAWYQWTRNMRWIRIPVAASLSSSAPV
jgi:4-amino-4-deoxy-L-arabinose transferase-like glycosyltransferase